jgi:transcriptional regulator with XRE-family HTH domain
MWSLADLASHTGMSADFLGLLERGLNMPSLATILRVAETFQIPAGRILDEIEADRPNRFRPVSL